MASEWVGVAGTAIGAGIGGVVTVVSLLINARRETEARHELADREEQHRIEDRASAAKSQQFRERRELYTALLAEADEVRSLISSIFVSGEIRKKGVDVLQTTGASGRSG